MSSLLYGRSYISQRCSVPVVCHNSNWGPAQSHEVDELWDIFIMITPTLTGFLSLMASTCEVKVGMKADARWQSIFKCEHCEGSALASFQWKSR